MNSLNKNVGVMLEVFQNVETEVLNVEAEVSTAIWVSREGTLQTL